jgi:hypothetical protein
MFLFSCKKYENVEFVFSHTIDGQPFQLNQLNYTNTAGNKYQVNEIKYFISKIVLINRNGESAEIKQNGGIHYVDCDINRTLHLKINEIPQGEYTALSFVFGLDENNNKSNRFVNPPECNFSWPEYLGGGYHYMQINGKFLNNKGELQNMNIHTGIGQIRDDGNEIKQFVHNHFAVTLPVNFKISEENRTILTLNMEIQRWFDTPNIYDLDEFGTSIMENQHAQELLKQNGWNVFEIMINDKF